MWVEKNLIEPEKDGDREVAEHAAEDDVVRQRTPPVTFGAVARLVARKVAPIFDAARKLVKKNTFYNN
jgi:hypothetical protein